MSLNREQLDAFLSVVFGLIVRHIREQRNQTQKPFAALLGISPEELEWIEDGTDASISVLYGISATTGISCARLGAAIQITAASLVDNPEVVRMITRKEWDALDVAVLKVLAANNDLLKLPVHNAVQQPAAGARVMPPLTPISGPPDDDDEPDPSDDEDGEDEKAPPARANGTSLFSHGTNASTVAAPTVPATDVNNPGVQRRKPGRPRKYPVPATNE